MAQVPTATLPSSSFPPAGMTPAVTGLIPPSLREGLIREAFPTVVGLSAGAAMLAKKLMQSLVLAPLGFLVLAPIFALKFAPFLCKRYTLTNRRLMIQRGIKPSSVQEIALIDIDEVRSNDAAVDPFYVSGTLEIVSNGQVVMTLPGVPEPEGFRHAILDSVKAWVPSKATGPFQSASEVK